jgi:hypothetical protein
MSIAFSLVCMYNYPGRAYYLDGKERSGYFLPSPEGRWVRVPGIPMICIHCGANNPDTAVVCWRCGQPLRPMPQEPFPSRVPPSQTQQQGLQAPLWQQPQQPTPSSWQPPLWQPSQPSQPLSRPSVSQPQRSNASPDAPTSVRKAANSSTARAASGRPWLFIGISGLVLLALIVGSVVFFLNHSFATTSNPASQTLTTYCHALASGDYQTAYAQLASGMKNQLKESDFAYSWQAQKVSSCTVDTSSVDASCTSTTCSGSITFFFRNGSSSTDQYQLMLENGQWKIQSQTSGS